MTYHPPTAYIDFDSSPPPSLLRPGYSTQTHYYKNRDYYYTAIYTAYVYQCWITMDKEIRFIWSKKMTFGKMLYLLTRYIPVLQCGLLLIIKAHSGTRLEISICVPVALLMWTFTFIMHASADVIMLMCIYALRGAKRGDIWRLGLLFWLFTGSASAMAYIIDFKKYAYRIQFSEKYPSCPMLLVTGLPRERQYFLGRASTLFLGRLVTMTLAVAVVVKRFSGQNDRFIKTIRQIGGCFYFTGLALGTVQFALALSWDCQFCRNEQWIREVADICQTLDSVLAPIFSTTLILSLRKIDDPSLREIMSNLVFEDQDDPEDLDNDEEEAAQGEAPYSDADQNAPDRGLDDGVELICISPSYTSFVCSERSEL